MTPYDLGVQLTNYHARGSNADQNSLTAALENSSIIISLFRALQLVLVKTYKVQRSRIFQYFKRLFRNRMGTFDIPADHDSLQFSYDKLICLAVDINCSDVLLSV